MDWCQGWKGTGVIIALGAVLSACSSGEGNDCTPGTKECRDGNTLARCATETSQWVTEACPAGTACGVDDCRPVVCDVGETGCSDDRLAAQVCEAPGVAWTRTACPDGEVCFEGTCGPPRCTPGQRRCRPYSSQFEECTTTGAEWTSPRSCPDGEACENGDCRAVVCQAAETRCSEDATAIETCSDYGTLWNASKCFGGNVCEDSKCRPVECDGGALRCRKDFLAVERCKDHGTDWVELAICPEGQACHEGACELRICAPNVWTCADDAGGRWQCNESGTARGEPQACDAGQACREGECHPLVCTPRTATCVLDATARLSCDSTGTLDGIREECDPEEACVSGACVPASSPLGEVLTIRKSDGTKAISPGLYAIAVVDSGEAGDPVPFPLAVNGEFTDPPRELRMAQRMAAPPPPGLPWRCGTPAASRKIRPLDPGIRHRLAAAVPRRAEVVGDTRRFWVLDDSSDDTLERRAILRHQGNFANFWEDLADGPAEGTLSTQVLQDIADRLDGGVFARNIALLGAPTDVDGNGRIDVLFTPLLPTQSAAAFVWPLTLYPSDPETGTIDHGEIVYSMRPGGDYSPADMAGIIAHETAHLLVAGRRISPWLDRIERMPHWVLGYDAYLGEGLAEIAHAWSGQGILWSAFSALQSPGLWHLGALFQNGYYLDGDLSTKHYGLGALVVGYLFQQGGGVEVTGPGAIRDLGGVPYLSAVIDREQGFPRLAPLDERPPSEWYADFATALLLTTVPEGGGPRARAEPRYRFPSATYDNWFGGFNGLPVRFQGEPAVSRSEWWQRSVAFNGGGANFLTALVSDPGAEVSVPEEGATAVLVRYKP